MGKGEDKPAEQKVEENPPSKDEIIKSVPKAEEEKTSKPPVEPTIKIEKTDTKESTAPKKDADSIRKVIKLGEDKDEKAGKSKEEDVIGDLVGSGETADSGPTATREALEQKRAMLQSIKNFDFQIKKNQEDISVINQKLASVSKDLDDLVSLYEIVSEQMNPFVGLSRVTKQRIDALENFIKEIDGLKTRVGDLESFAERTGGKIEDFKGQLGQPVPTNIKSGELSDEDLYKIIEKALKETSSEEKIDMAIDEFIEELKKEKA